MKHPLIIERPDLQSRATRTIYSLVTLVAWLSWLYLWMPLLSLLLWALGVRLFAQELVLPHNFNYLGQLALYGIVMAGLLTLVVCWSQYNFRRFRGVDRRAAPELLAVEDEARHYHLDPQLVRELKAARVATVFYEERKLIWLRLTEVQAADETAEARALEES